LEGDQRDGPIRTYDAHAIVDAVENFNSQLVGIFTLFGVAHFCMQLGAKPPPLKKTRVGARHLPGFSS
jgi:hypothetical protein